MITTLRLPYPISANRYWRTRIYQNRVMTHVSPEAQAYKQQAALLANVAGIRASDSEMQITLILHPKLTKAGEASKVCLDLDNAIKVTIDALNGTAWKDDKQVRHIMASFGNPIADGGLTVSVGAME